MLESLSIRDIVLIEKLALDFAPGLNVLTGETGAGKSILLDALGFALGRREAKGLTRAGAADGSVSAVLRIDAGHPVHAIMAEAGLDPAEGEIVLRRIASADGPSRAFVNDQRVSAAALRAIGETLIEVHGQHDDRGLLNARGHRAILDAFAGVEAELTACRAAYRRAREAAEALSTAEAAAEAVERDREWLTHAAAELENFAPEVEEDAALDTRRRLMQGAERIREEVARAAAAIGESGAEGVVGDAMRRLDGAAEAAEGRLDAPLEALSRALDALGEASSGVEAALEALDFDPTELERVEERLFALRALARKHRCPPDELPALAARLSARLALIVDGESALAGLRAAAGAADAALKAAAAALTVRRVEAAARLDTAVADELPPLKMERARFETRIEPLAEAGPEGADKVTFTVATNPGAAAGPIAAIASGGELSRFLLALKAALSAEGGAGVMIFDEIDRGVGGATADAVGRRLGRIAEGAQVLVVTHSPQVAALGDAHFRIEKTVAGGEARTGVLRLEGTDRRDEVARMLAGDTVTDAARAAADALMG